MKWLEFKDLVVKDCAIFAMGALYLVIKILDRVTKEKTIDIKFFKVKTKSHHVRLLVDRNIEDPLILVRPKGLLKLWTAMERKGIPNCLINNIFEESCSKKERHRLVNKMMGLKAFW